MKRSAVLLPIALGFFVGSLSAQTDAPQSPSKDAAVEIPAVAPAANPPISSAAPAAKSVQPPASRPRFVPVLVSATDASGNPATGLTKDQFSILDTMRPVQALQVYKAADIPLHLAVVLLAAPGTFSQQQSAAIDLVQKIIRPNTDEAFVVTARGKKAWPSSRLDWKQDPSELAKIIGDLDHNAGLRDAFNFDLNTDETAGDENGGRSTIQTYSGAGVNVFDAVYSMMNSDPRPARRVMVIFREPWAHSPGFGLRVNNSVEGKLLQIISVAQQMHITTFVIGLEDSRFNGITDNTLGKTYISLHAGDDGGAGTSTRTYDSELEKEKIHAYDAGRTNVQRLASETGGATFWSAKKNYSDAVKSIANLINGQYIITFTPSEAPTPVHTLKVTGGAGTKMLAQSTFFYGPDK